MMTDSYEIETPIDDECDPIYDIETLWKDTVSEFIGTFIFVYIGLSGVNQSMIQGINNLTVSVCFTFALSVGILIANRSGGHLNPAVSFTTLLTNPDFNIKRFVMYLCAQVLGSMLGALLVLIMYGSYINNYKHKEMFVGTFGTMKSSQVSMFSSIIDQLIGSAFLMFAIEIIPDNKFKPFQIGGCLGALGLFQGLNGFAFNPARDFGPRIVSSFAIGTIAFSSNDSWCLIPIIMPFIGMPIGFIFARVIKMLQ